MRPSCSSRNVRCMHVRNEAAPAYVTLLYVRNVIVMLRYEFSDCVAATCTEKESNTRSVQFNSVKPFRDVSSKNWQFVVDKCINLLIPVGKMDYMVLQAPCCCNRTIWATHGDERHSRWFIWENPAVLSYCWNDGITHMKNEHYLFLVVAMETAVSLCFILDMSRCLLFERPLLV